MGVRVRARGIRSAQAALRRAFQRVENATEEMLTVSLQAINANTVPYVPVDTSALINSDVRAVLKTSTGFLAYIAYGAPGASGASGTPVQEYAIYVHEGPQKNWQKPGASNRFLAKGVDDFLRDDLDDIVRAFKL